MADLIKPVVVDTASIIEKIDAEYTSNLLRAKEQFPALLQTLKDIGTTDTVTISFSGYGDEGDIDFVEGIPSTGDAEKDSAIEQQVADWANTIATNTGYDWWNNEGGQGSLDISVKDNSFDLSIDQAERVYTNVFKGHYQEGQDTISSTPVLRILLQP